MRKIHYYNYLMSGLIFSSCKLIILGCDWKTPKIWRKSLKNRWKARKIIWSKIIWFLLQHWGNTHKQNVNHIWLFFNLDWAFSMRICERLASFTNFNFFACFLWNQFMKFEKISVLLISIFDLILSGFPQILSVFQLYPLSSHYDF